MKKYDHKKIEKKWQKNWKDSGIYFTREDEKKKKYYVLDMFPYPSGAGLHVGHPKGYIATDVVARMKMMQGHNVLHPMGWDAFGLPAENYAIKNKVHPAEATAKNIATFKKQMCLLGFTYDWSREINTTDPKYYKWTQWAFIQMFKRGLVIESNEPINWCPECQTGLANEDLDNGLCERCGSAIIRKPMRQWVIKITEYAERLLEDLEKLSGWPEPIREMQKNWIGRSEGAEVVFRVKNHDLVIKVFTTRPDTLFGATYVVLAPEHDLINELKKEIANFGEVAAYMDRARKKSELERAELQKEKTGVELHGLKAVNPANGEELPIFTADYVVGGYGTGAIMCVPGHDERDFEFAKKYGLPIKEVVSGGDASAAAFTGEGKNINSGFLNGLATAAAKEKMYEWLSENKAGGKKINYKLRDWVFSRQRYWGEPIPLVKCDKCGWVPVPEEDLPLELPKVKHYEPTGTGESPLANIEKWVNTKCPVCGGPAKRETNTMPQWAGSCWYYLRYEDPRNEAAPVDKKKEKFWSPVDLYVGGAEHATRHLIYARFWHKFLYDIGAVNYEEPFTRLQNVGLILAEDGRKMSKRWGNVINPDDIVAQYGADSMRVYEMFMGPFDQACAWSTSGLVGARRFIERVWNLQEKLSDSADGGRLTTFLHQTIKKVSEDIEFLRFNTAIAQMMALLNEMTREEKVSREHYRIFLQLLAPFAPHLGEELWQALGSEGSIFAAPWPQYKPELARQTQITLAVQVNGKLRDTLTVRADIGEEEAKEKAMNSEKVKKWLAGKQPQKIIYVKGKLVSIVA